MTKLSVALEHRESFEIFYAAANMYLHDNKKPYAKGIKKFKNAIELPLLQLASDKLANLFGDEYVGEIPIEFEFFTYAPTGNSGGTDFMFDDPPELAFFINFNTALRDLYKKDLRLFSLTLADVYTHELVHGIQYIKQYQSIGNNEDLVKDNLFKRKEHLFKKDARYNTIKQYTEDLPYFSNHEELVCYAKDSARQLLTVFKEKEIIIAKLSNTKGLQELMEASDCFYYYYDCFYNNRLLLPQYEFLWRRFAKQVYVNLDEAFAI